MTAPLAGAAAVTAARPFADLPDLPTMARARDRVPAPWTAGLAAALLLHGVLAGVLANGDLRVSASEAPEALVMIDLPAELARPPAETVASLAAPEMSGDAPDGTDAPIAPAPTVVAPAPPPETPASMAPESREPQTAPVGAAAAAIAEPAAEIAPTVDAVADAAPEPAVSTEVVPAAPARLPPPRPKPPPPSVEPVRRAAAERAKPARPAPERRSAVAAQHSEAASGAGRPDADALARYLASVRADILRQRLHLGAGDRGRLAVVRFRIAASGAIGGITVTRSSGSARLDAAAVDLVQRASPVPAIPRDLERSSLVTSLPVAVR